MVQLRLQQGRLSNFSCSPSLQVPVKQRPSEYFGALKVDYINEWEQPDPKLTQLFEECFGKNCPPPRPAVKAKK